MTKPENIPQRIWDRADSAVTLVNDISMREKQVETIARAIMAEREACAQVAWLYSKQGATHDQIAAAIRNRP